MIISNMLAVLLEGVGIKLCQNRKSDMVTQCFLVTIYFITNFLYKKKFFVTLIIFCGLFIDV